jgi:hypothetical protein
MANMKRIAELAGVSLGTVSHVLNGTARVREPLRQRVLDAVHQTLTWFTLYSGRVSADLGAYGYVVGKKIPLAPLTREK